MKTSKAKLTVLMTIAALLVSAGTQAQIDIGGHHSFKSKSLKVAKRYLLWGTLIPVAAGFAWYKLDGPGKKTHYPGTRTVMSEDDSGEKVASILISCGLIIGPSLGYYYGGCSKRGTIGLGIRIGTGAAAGLLAAAIAKSYESRGWWDLGGLVLPLGVIGIGAGIILWEAVIDIAHVKNYVEQNNLKKIGQARYQVSLVPQYFADPGAGGLQLNVTF